MPRVKIVLKPILYPVGNPFLIERIRLARNILSRYVCLFEEVHGLRIIDLLYSCSSKNELEELVFEFLEKYRN